MTIYGFYIVEARIDNAVHEFGVTVLPSEIPDRLRHEVFYRDVMQLGMSVLIDNVRTRLAGEPWFQRADFQPVAIVTPDGERITQFSPSSEDEQ